MNEDLSLDEKEALSRFVAQIIADVQKVSALFELRGADSSATRAAQAHLETALSGLRSTPRAQAGPNLTP
jgi:hypothetical protein